VHKGSFLGVACAVIACVFGLCSAAQAATATLTSSNFSVGFGFTNASADPPVPFGWNTSETAGQNTPTTQGDFTFVPTVTSANNSSGGCTFIDRVLESAASNGRSAIGDGFAATVTGTYTGPEPADVLVPGSPNYQLSVNISAISIYNCAFNATGSNMGFSETTAGHTATQDPLITDPVPPNDANTAANYTQVIWDPADFSEPGTSSTRSFALAGPGVNAGVYQIDGYEIFGTVTLTYDAVPEPGSLAFFAAIGAVAALRRRRA